MLTRIADRKILCVYIYGPYNSLRHADNRRYFSGLSNAKSKGSTHVLLVKEVGKFGHVLA